MVVLWIVAQTAVADKGTSHISMLENLSFGYQFWLPPQNFVAKSYDLVVDQEVSPLSIARSLE